MWIGKDAVEIDELLEEMQAAFPLLKPHELLKLALRAFFSLSVSATLHAKEPIFTPEELASETWREIAGFPGFWTRQRRRISLELEA